MNDKERIALLKELIAKEPVNESDYYETLEKCDALKGNYGDFMTTAPIDCNAELLRLRTAGYDLCCALITMLLREDHFSNGTFERRYAKGEVTPIIERMILLLEIDSKSGLH